MFLLKRYLFDYIVFVVISLLSWFASIYYLEGFIPSLIGFATLGVIVGYIPYMIKQDYNTVKECVVNFNLVRKGEMTKTEFGVDVVKKVCDETGLPEMVVDYSLKKMKLAN